MLIYYSNDLSKAIKRHQFVLKLTLLILCLTLPSSVVGQFLTKGDAVKVSDRCFKVTENSQRQFGAVWWDQKIDLRQPLELDFILNLGSRDANGADGVAFVLHNDLRGVEARGTLGGGLGFAYHSTYSNNPGALDVIKPSVSIEFDTHYNREYSNEPAGDHTTIVYDGDLTKVVIPAVSINPDHPNVEDGQCHSYKIKWDPATQELQLYFDGKLRFSHKDDIVNKVFNGNSSVYIGFTGSTGVLTNEQIICIDNPDSKLVAVDDAAVTAPFTAVSIAVLENDSHTDRYPISLKSIVNPPVNGIVRISGDKLVYTPSVGFVGTDFITYEVCETSSDKCSTKCSRAVVKVEVGCSSTLTAPDVFHCGPGKVKLAAQGGTTTGTYRWYTSAEDNAPIAGETDSHFVTPLLSTTTTFYVAFHDGSCESVRTPVRAVIEELPTVYAGEDAVIFPGEQVQLQGTGDGIYSWWPADGLDNAASPHPIAHPDKTTTYTLTVTNPDGCSATDEVTVTVLDGIFVPTAFSPNNDGLNEVWEIFRIAAYPNCRVEVYNRWGNLVFNSKGYEKPWDGTFNGKKLPMGSYAYIIKLGKGEKPITGSVFIKY